MPDFDTPLRWPVTDHRVKATGIIADFVEDTVLSPEGETMSREYLRHPGSVAILALDEDERVAVLSQYRHPLGWKLLEIPAGLLDVSGEPPLHAAQRELAEEVGLAADNWSVLIDYFNSPGITDELARIYLATGLRAVPTPEGFERHGEELDMKIGWMPLEEIYAAIFAGQVQNVALMIAALAYYRVKSTGVRLRPGDAPWEALRLRDERRSAQR
jgi:ADP-ribose pyrophosphatase